MTTSETAGLYRKKPIPLEAKCWQPGDLRAAGEVVGWLTANGADFHHPSGQGETTTLAIRTLEGPLTARPGDWIIKGTKGEFWPVRGDVFAETYEPADGDQVTFPDAPLLTGIGSGDWHAIPKDSLAYALEGPAYSVAFAACGELVRVAVSYGAYDRATTPVTFHPCQQCAWTVAAEGGASAIEAEIGRLPSLAGDTCRAILGRARGEDADYAPTHPATIQLLATVATHAPVDLVSEDCAEGDCEHADGEHPSSTAACLACSLVTGDWAGAWEGHLRSECIIKAPCAVLLALAGDPQ